MRTAKLHIVRPQEVPVEPRPSVNWVRGLRITGMVLWWVLWGLWQVIKVVMVVAVVTMGLVLIMIGILAYFVQGPPR